MALWSNTDANTSAPKFTVDTTSGNTGIQAYQQTPIGTFGVDSAETQANEGVTHAGWVLRTVGSGGRSGRIQQETLVAMGSMGADGDASDDSTYVDAVITITSLTGDQTANVGDDVEIIVTASVVPNQTLSYQWYIEDGDVELTGETSAILEFANVQTANANTFYVVVSAGDVSEQSANTTLTVEE